MSVPTTAHAFLALDIGATKADVAVVSPTGGILNKARIAVAEHPTDLYEAIVGALADVRAHHDVVALGVACSGPMSKIEGWVSPLNIPQWRDFPLFDRLVADMALPVELDGDVRALALAEGLFGAARGVVNYGSMVVSTGVGSALVMDGSLLDGATGNAGHLGHICVVPGGNPCSCGATGCLEAHASGWAIAKQVGASPADAPMAVRWEVAGYVGQAIGTMASVLDCPQWFIGGSVALGYGDDFFVEANRVARTYATMHYSAELQIAPTGLGADGPILGAAILASQALG